MRIVTIVLTLSMVISFSFGQDIFQAPQKVIGSGYTNGLCWADYNDDGYPDLYVSNGVNGAPTNVNYLYLNNGDGTFTEQTSAGPIVSDDYISGGCSWGDYDNDGQIDMVVAHAFTRATDPFTNYSKISLYRNQGDSTFTSENGGDLTVEETISKSAAAFVDYDNDGFVDVFVSNAKFTGPPATTHSLYHNNQDGTFTSVSNNLTNGTSARAGFSWADFDLDGDMDVVTASGAIVQWSVLWVNTGSDFTETKLDSNQTSEGVSWVDFDNDGDLDIFFANSGDTEDAREKNVIFRNDNGTFVKVDTLLGDLTADRDLSEGASWGDYDNDGDLDVIVANADSAKGDASKFYLNNGDGTFTEHTADMFQDSSTYAYSISNADVDNDGDLDVVIGRDGKNQLYINQTSQNSSNHFLEISLVGDVAANRSAIGAIVRLKATIGGTDLWLIRDVNSQTGRGSHNDYRVHFGLGDATVADSIIVKWPGSGTQIVYTNVAADQFLTYKESDQPNAIANQDFSPKTYSLQQNYPNPFNPTTNIRYSLAENTHVKLAVYNSAGQLIRTLVDEKQLQGSHMVTFDGTGISSGVYFYRLETSTGFQQIKKLVLLK